MGTVHNKNSRKPQFTQQCPQPSLMWSDTIFPGQPKHIPNSLRGKKQVVGGCGTRHGSMWLGRARESWGEQAVRSRKKMSGTGRVFKAGKGLSCDCRQGRAGRSCEVGETGDPSLGPPHLAAPFLIVQEKVPLSLSEMIWVRNLFFGNGDLSQAPKLAQNPQNHNRTWGWLIQKRPRQARSGKQT